MISNKDRNFLERAGLVAALSTERQRHGCVITRGGSVLAVGVNTFRNHPNTVSNPSEESSFHAEVNAIRSVVNGVAGATAYVARVNRAGQIRMSMPCIRCYRALEAAGIKRVVWTTNTDEIEEISI